jgi:CheY-like chemotaxis protein
VSGAGGHDAAREIARGLSQIVAQALDDGASVRTLEAARDLAQLLSLRGLDRLLGALSPHAGTAWPAPLEPAIEQVRRAAAECGRAGNVEALRRADDELARMAQAIERVPSTLASPNPASPAPGTAAEHRSARTAAESAPVPLADALEGLPVQRESEELSRKVRLHPPVAGALRAALDWLIGEGATRLRLWLVSDGSALEVTCESVVFPGVQPASEVLANVGAHLGPAVDRPGAWTVRVPILAERETFLMLEQDELQLAVPWHAVARVRLMPADTIDAMARRQGLPVLAPLAVAPRRAAEQPVVVVALGLKRACLVADRLVWRMPALPAEPEGAPPATGIARAVRSDDGELYWVLDPAWLLRGIAAPVVADVGRHGLPPPPAAPPRPPAPLARQEPAVPPPPIPFPSAAMRGRPVQPAGGPVRSLGAQDVEPLETAASPPPAPAPPPSPATPMTPPAPATPRQPAPPPAWESRPALVAEDSITARIFLVRLLEQRGFAVHAVGTAAELRTLLPQGPWALVCADLELPDARGQEFLLEVMRGAGATRSPLVALVRDAADEAVARAAGVAATLRKPYERDSLERILGRLVPDLPGRADRGPGGVPDPRDWGAR